ncbi:MAG: hypothetical protein AAGI07_18535 [Bacteroidota bacterium]
MSKESKILTLHPQGKRGVNIDFNKYEQVKDVILKIVEENTAISFSDMADLSNEILLQQHFNGKPLWYITTVKLDLEARGIIERIPKTSPHKIRLVSKKA